MTFLIDNGTHLFFKFKQKRFPVVVCPHSYVGQLLICGDGCNGLKVKPIAELLLSGVTQPSAWCSAPLWFTSTLNCSAITLAAGVFFLCVCVSWQAWKWTLSEINEDTRCINITLWLIVQIMLIQSTAAATMKCWEETSCMKG